MATASARLRSCDRLLRAVATSVLFGPFWQLMPLRANEWTSRMVKSVSIVFPAKRGEKKQGDGHCPEPEPNNPTKKQEQKVDDDAHQTKNQSLSARRLCEPLQHICFRIWVCVCWRCGRLCSLAERLSCGDGERKTPMTRPTATSRCHQRFVRPRWFGCYGH